MTAASWREQPAPAGHPADQVQRQAEHLERDEHDQQVVRGDEQHHAADGERRQRVDLGLHPLRREQLAVARAAGRNGGRRHERRAGRVEGPLGEQQDRQRAEPGDRRLQEQPGAVDGERAAGGDLAGAGAAAACRPGRRGCRRARRRPGRGAGESRGQKASTSTPMQAAPKTNSSGASAARERSGASITRSDPPRSLMVAADGRLDQVRAAAAGRRPSTMIRATSGVDHGQLAPVEVERRAACGAGAVEGRGRRRRCRERSSSGSSAAARRRAGRASCAGTSAGCRARPG